MRSTPSNPQSYKRRRDRTPQRQSDRQRFWAGNIVLLGMVLAVLFNSPHPRRLYQPAPNESPSVAPLVMQGGDPYIRALMRTISASEANGPDPYSLIYGGDRIEDLSHHPDECVPILVGPNVGNCTTAAGRYQFLTTTWLEKADQYHPAPPAWYTPWKTYSFEPEFQDEVVYAWLSDSYVWGYNLSELLRQGELEFVLQLLSETWTSLGYGIEDNVVTPVLPEIYQAVLEEELSASQAQ